MARLKVIILAILLIAINQQLTGQAGMRFSFHADPQLAWFSSDDDSIAPDGSILHLQAGLLMDKYFADNYAFYIGFGVNNLGGKLLYQRTADYMSDADTVTVAPGQQIKMNLQYLDIPIGLKLKTEELGYVTFFLRVGFNPMVNINAKASSDTESVTGPLNKQDIKKSVNLFHLGYHVGAGIEYRLGGKTALIGGLRWASGFTNVTQKDGVSLRLNTLSVNLGILF